MGIVGQYEDGNGNRIAGCQCEQSQCAWWNERFGKCCQAVDAYLKGAEDSRNEAKVSRQNRW
jgi:hypothetical protein